MTITIRSQLGEALQRVDTKVIVTRSRSSGAAGPSHRPAGG